MMKFIWPRFGYRSIIYYTYTIVIINLGTSDPYVKFKLNGRLLHKSKTVHKDLNPIWDETFVVAIEDPFQSILIKVFDYDWGFQQDDFMGSALLDLTTLELSKVTELMVPLEDSARPSAANAAPSKSKWNIFQKN